MELTEYLKKIKGSEGYRIFLTGLNKQFKSAGVLYREFKILERMTTIALKIIHFVHSFTPNSTESFTASYKPKLLLWLIVSIEEEFALSRMRT
jgi:hypothetical protein